LARLAKNKMALLRIHRIQRRVAYNTQTLRQGLMSNLKELFDFSNEQARNSRLDMEPRQFWVQPYQLTIL